MEADRDILSLMQNYRATRDALAAACKNPDSTAEELVTLVNAHQLSCRECLDYIREDTEAGCAINRAQIEKLQRSWAEKPDAKGSNLGAEGREPA
jgi:uncharacterized radical SAM superfamily Fe-S cluster-containing enzyme